MRIRIPKYHHFTFSISHVGKFELTSTETSRNWIVWIIHLLLNKCSKYIFYRNDDLYIPLNDTQVNNWTSIKPKFFSSGPKFTKPTNIVKLKPVKVVVPIYDYEEEPKKPINKQRKNNSNKLLGLVATVWIVNHVHQCCLHMFNKKKIVCMFIFRYFGWTNGSSLYYYVRFSETMLCTKPLLLLQ